MNDRRKDTAPPIGLPAAVSYVVVGLLLLLAAITDRLLLPDNFASVVYAVPLLFASLALTPRHVIAVAVVALALAVVGAVWAVTPPLDSVVRLSVLVAIAYIAVRFAEERRRTLRHAQEADAARLRSQEIAAGLRESEERQRLILANSPDIVFVQDTDLRYVWIINPAPPVREEDVVGKTDFDLLPPAQAQKLADIKRRVMETGVGAREELVLSPGGIERWYDAAYEPFRDAEGRTVGIAAYARDITERKRAEEQIRTTLESIGDGFFAVDAEWRFVYVNAAAERILRIKREEVLGRSHWEVFPLTLGTGLEREYRRAAAGEAGDFENFYESWGRWFHAVSYPRDGGGMSVYFQDITERKWAEEEREHLLAEVQRQAAELQAVLDNMVDGVFVCDAEGQITLVNKAAVRLLGADDAEEVKHHPTEIAARFHVQHSDGRPIAADEHILIRSLRGETVVLEDQTLVNLQTGQQVYVRGSAAPIRDEAGRIVAAVAVVRDVTELQELERLKDHFISVAAHELKTPVAIMKGYAQMIPRTMRDASPQTRKMLDAIDHGADRISSIVNDLLDISRLEASSLELSLERVDLPQLVEEVMDWMAITASKHRIRLVGTEPVVVQGDRDRLKQVLVNMVDNAIRYSPAGGDVDVAMAIQSREVVVSVADRGVGIPAEKQARIFQRFYRAHTHTPHDYGGMGVGLFISKEIVERHGGRMWFESEEGVGSTFYFALPLAR